MSSDEEEYEYSSDGGGYSDDVDGDEEDEGAILIANTFYEADDDKTHHPERAITGFEKVIALEKERGDEVKMRFKALENLVVLHTQLRQMDKMVARYEEMLTYIRQVTSNETLDAINAVLDAVTTMSESAEATSDAGATSGAGAGGASGSSASDMGALSKMYEITLEALKSANNERLWFNTNVKLAKLYFSTDQLKKLEALIRELHNACKLPDGSDDPAKGTYLMEMYALDIKLCTCTGNTGRMADIHEKVTNLSAAINDPRIMGDIHENFGQMHMARAAWNEAYQEFFDAFRSYSEAGNVRARTCLKYVVLANMMANEEINPFDSQEAKVFKEDPEVTAMWRLRNAFTEKNFEEFYTVLGNPKNRINSDPFIVKYLQPLIDSFRSVVVLNILRPYRHVSLEFLAKEVKATPEEVEALLVAHILDGSIHGTIDQVKGYLHVNAGSKATTQSYGALGTWTTRLEELQERLETRLK